MTGTSFQTANRIQVSDDNIWHYLTPTEKEKYFVFNGEIGKNYIFRTYGNFDLMAYLYDDSFTQIMMDDDGAGDRNPLLNIPIHTTRNYYIKIKGYNDPTETVNFYLSLREGTLDVDDPYDPYEDIVVVRCTAIPIYGYGRRIPTSG